MSRQRININRERRSLRAAAPNGADSALDDSSWQRVNLPHTFDLAYFRAPEFYVGAGWYRRTIDVPADWQNKRVFLEFDGTFQIADVYVNGHHVGQHRGGYTGFSTDITNAMTAGSVPVDSVDTSFGIRWFEWTADQGFFLNGAHLYLRGAGDQRDAERHLSARRGSAVRAHRVRDAESGDRRGRYLWSPIRAMKGE